MVSEHPEVSDHPLSGEKNPTTPDDTWRSTGVSVWSRAFTGRMFSLESFFRITQELLKSRDLKQLLSGAAEGICELARAESGMAALGFRDGRFRFEASVGWSFWAGKERELKPLNLGRNVLKELIRREGAFRCKVGDLPDAQHGDLGNDPEILRAQIVAVPIHAEGGEIGGIIAALNRSDGRFEAEDEPVLNQLASVVSMTSQHLGRLDRLEQRSQGFAAWLGATTNGLMIVDQQGCLVEANRAIVDHLGVNPVHLRFDTFAERIALSTLDGQRLAADRQPSTLALEGQEVRGMCLSFIRADGNQSVGVFSATPIWRDEEVAGAIVLLHTATIREKPVPQFVHHSRLGSFGNRQWEDKLKGAARFVGRQIAAQMSADGELVASQERFRKLIRAAPIGMVLTNKAGEIIDANDVFCRLLETSLSAVRLTKAIDFYGKPQVREEFWNTVGAKNGGGAFVTMIRREDGATFPVLLYATPIEFREESALLTTVTDLTQPAEVIAESNAIGQLWKHFLSSSNSAVFMRHITSIIQEECACNQVEVRLLGRPEHLSKKAVSGVGCMMLVRDGKYCGASQECQCLQTFRSTALAANAAQSVVISSFKCEELTHATHDDGCEAWEGEIRKPGCDFASVAVAAIRSGRDLLGTIELVDRRVNHFGRRAIKLLEMAAALVGESIIRFEAVESLRLGELQFRAQFEKQGAIMLLVDRAGSVVADANHAAARFFKRSREQMRNLPLSELGIEMAPHQELKWSFDQSEWGAYEATALPADGSRRSVEVYCSLISIQSSQFILAVLHDITEQTLLEREVIETCEAERQRIGRDLHDSLGGHLTGVALLAKALSKQLAKNQVAESATAEEIVVALNEAIRRTRRLAHQLSPANVSETGLLRALRVLLEDIQRFNQVECAIDFDEKVKLSNADATLHLFRIAEEAIQNALRHGQAKRIKVSLRRSGGSILFRIWNDGLPLPEAIDLSRGIGIRGMHYRASIIKADLDIRSTKGDGTEVCCRMGSKRVLCEDENQEL